VDTAPDMAGTLEEAILSAHDDLLRALRLEPMGDDRFRAGCERGRFDRIFGGQLLAQALVAAGATVTDQEPDSLHAYFTGAGTVEQPVELSVARVREGRSLSTRRVEITQEGRPLLAAIASFHANPTGPELETLLPSGPRPEEVPALQDWVAGAPSSLQAIARVWIDRPPPLELRIGEPPYFMGGSSKPGTRSHWMRLIRDVKDSSLHVALLAYASDYFLLDMAFRSFPGAVPAAQLTGLSVDHAIWIHRPVDLATWHLHTQETLALAGHRGLVRGSIHDQAGRLVASVAQEVLVRVNR
jgi:acyl-CoA thioesterase-2